jgi:hypothetical protein
MHVCAKKKKRKTSCHFRKADEGGGAAARLGDGRLGAAEARQALPSSD